MTRVCIIGNSHIGALKQGWDRVAGDHPDAFVTFFGAPRAAMEALSVADGALVPTTSELRESMRRTSCGEEGISGSFDCYVVCALEFSIKTILAIYMKARNAGVVHLDDFPAEARAALRNNIATRTIRKLRQCTNAPILLIAAPFRAYPKSDLFWGIPERETRSVAAIFERASKQIAKRHGALFLPQPAETVSPNRVTSHLVFARAQEPDAKEESLTYMNADFGALVMRQVLAAAARDQSLASAT